MKPSRMTEVLVDVLQTKWPVFIWGPQVLEKAPWFEILPKNRK